MQGASDSGLIPMFYPDYQRVGTPEARQRFEKLWRTALDPDPGLTVVEIMNAAKKHEIRGMYVMGENPAMSDPDVDHAREALAALDHLVVQDIFLTETAYLADVVLAATAWPEKIGTVTNTDRMVQLGRKAIEPPGDAREDFWILNELARRIGVDWYYDHPRDVFNEMRTCMDSIAGITWERLERESSVTYPCVKEGDPGDPVVFCDDFPTESGRAKFVPADLISAAERPDAEYPMVLITGRQLEHWHTGSMTRRASNLDSIEPEPVASVHPLDLEATEHRARRNADHRIAARPDLALRARRRWNAARHGVRAVLLLRGRGEHADQPGARSVREDSGVQVLRGEGHRRRPDADAYEFRRRRPAARTSNVGAVFRPARQAGLKSRLYVPTFDRDRQQHVPLAQLHHAGRQLPGRELAGAASIAQLANLKAIQIVDLFAQQRDRRVGARAQPVPGQRVENFGLQAWHFNTYSDISSSAVVGRPGVARARRIGGARAACRRGDRCARARPIQRIRRAG